MPQNLMDASHQWATRPNDERFETLQDLWMATRLAANRASASDLLMKRLTVEAVDGDLRLKTPQESLSFNNWSFGQFARRLGAPSDYIQSLPADLAAENLNYSITRNADVDAQVYFDNQSKTVRAITSTSYGRVLNHDVVKALIELPGHWVTPPARPARADAPGTRPATAEDIAKYGAQGHPTMSVKVGDPIDPRSGIYGNDRDMFVFLIDPTANIDDGSEGGLGRGFFARNSEVGNAQFELCTFLYRYVCGNHIVWDASDVKILKVKHLGRGTRARAFDKIEVELKNYAQKSTDDDRQRITRAKNLELGSNIDDVIELVYEKRHLLPKKKVEEAYNTAEQYAGTDGSPRTAWGFANGVTRLSQKALHIDERNELDFAAGRILALAD